MHNLEIILDHYRQSLGCPFDTYGSSANLATTGEEETRRVAQA